MAWTFWLSGLKQSEFLHLKLLILLPRNVRRAATLCTQLSSQWVFLGAAKQFSMEKVSLGNELFPSLLLSCIRRSLCDP